MEPRETVVPAPLKVRIADDLRMRIEAGELKPGDSLPTLQELVEQWQCSMDPVRAAVALLKQQGLITGGRGKAPVVRTPPRQVIRSANRHQAEKDLVLTPESVRGRIGTSEIEMGVEISNLGFKTTYQIVDADRELAEVFRLELGAPLLQRIFEYVNPSTGFREAWSVSHIPKVLVEGNPRLLDANNEPWPGGTQHQLFTVGIEIAHVTDRVTATMPSTADAQLWDLDGGVPMLKCRRISLDAEQRVVETSDAEYPADRTVLSFETPLSLWSDEQLKGI